jgi:hypothetical protein
MGAPEVGEDIILGLRQNMALDFRLRLIQLPSIENRMTLLVIRCPIGPFDRRLGCLNPSRARRCNQAMAIPAKPGQRRRHECATDQCWHVVRDASRPYGVLRLLDLELDDRILLAHAHCHIDQRLLAMLLAAAGQADKRLLALVDAGQAMRWTGWASVTPGFARALRPSGQPCCGRPPLATGSCPRRAKGTARIARREQRRMRSSRSTVAGPNGSGSM